MAASDSPPRAHLHGLDGLRAVACLAVFVDHVEQYREWLGLTHHFGKWMTVLGRQGVELFFVLSGYLITYRMFLERRKTGEVSIPRFYFRRALRIWPLYYCTLFVIFFVVPWMCRRFGGPFVHDASGWYFDGMFAPGDHRFAWYAVLLPHVAYFTSPALLAGSHCWSIGVEEQFYLFWPWLMRWFKRRELLGFALVVVGMVLFDDLVFPWGDALVKPRVGDAWLGRLRDVADHAHFEAMAIGGFVGWAAAHRQSDLDRLASSPAARLLAYVAIPFAVYEYGLWHGQLGPALLYAYALAVLSHGPESALLDAKWVSAVGERSYAIYLVHPFAMLGMAIALERIGGRAWHFAGPLYVVLSASATALLAFAAHRFIEKPALRLKDRLPRRPGAFASLGASLDQTAGANSRTSP